MSIEHVNQFYQVVSRDPALQLQFQFAADEESLVKMAVELGQQQGYSFTSEDVMQAIAIAQPSTATSGMVELADEQLEAVAGGFGKGLPPAPRLSPTTKPYTTPQPVFKVPTQSRGEVGFVKQQQEERGLKISL